MIEEKNTTFDGKDHFIFQKCAPVFMHFAQKENSAKTKLRYGYLLLKTRTIP